MKIFEENPNLDEVFQTADAELFMTRNAAENHAKTLEAKTVKRILRPDAKHVSVVDVTDPNVIPVGTFQTRIDENGKPNIKQAVVVLDNTGEGTLNSVEVSTPKADADLIEKPLPEVSKNTDVVEVSVKTNAGTTNRMPQNVNSATTAVETKAEDVVKPIVKPAAKTKVDNTSK